MEKSALRKMINDVQLLMTFLSQEKPSEEQKKQAQELIDRGQVFFLNYERDEPLKDDSDRKEQDALRDNLNKKGGFVFSISHHDGGKIYPGLHSTFSRLLTYNNPEPKNWLEKMRLPIKAGYELKSVRIVYIPSMEIKKQNYEKCHKVLNNLIKELENIRPDYKQFIEYDKAKLSAGKWDDGDWPLYYPNFTYRYGYGEEIPNSKGFYKKTTENWCYISIGFGPARGDPKAQPHGGRTYARQGVEAYWFVESEDKELNKRITVIINKGLFVLDEYEKELENNR